MSHARLFVPQEALESWLTVGRAELNRDTLTFDGHRFHITGGVRFLAEVAGGPDELALVGRVKSREQLAALSAEHSGESVVLGDNAYQVAEGYLLSPVIDSSLARGTAHFDGKTDPYPQIISLFARP